MRSWLCSEQVGEEENDGCFKHDFPFRGRRVREPRNGLLIGTLLLSNHFTVITKNRDGTVHQCRRRNDFVVV